MGAGGLLHEIIYGSQVGCCSLVVICIPFNMKWGGKSRLPNFATI